MYNTECSGSHVTEQRTRTTSSVVDHSGARSVGGDVRSAGLCLWALRSLTLVRHAHVLSPSNVGIDHELLVLLHKSLCVLTIDDRAWPVSGNMRCRPAVDHGKLG